MFLKSISKKLIRRLISKRDIKLVDAIFICGSGRSGTSMLRTDLAKEMSIYSPPENFATFRIIIIVEILYYLKLSSLIPFIISEVFVNTADHKESWKIAKSKLRKLIKSLPGINRTSENILLIIHKCFMESQGIEIDYILDKTPNNTYHLDILLMIFPNGKIIHLVRNPHDVINSYTKSPHRKFHKKTATDFELRWISSNMAVEKIKSRIDYFLLRYEDYIEFKKQKLRDIEAFSNLKSKRISHPDFDFGDLTLYPHHSNALKGFKANIIPNEKVKVSEFQNPELIKNLALRYNYVIE